MPNTTDSLRLPLRVVAVVNALLALPSLLGLIVGGSLLTGGLGSPTAKSWLAVGLMAAHIVVGIALVVGYVLAAFRGKVFGRGFWWASLAYNVYVALGGLVLAGIAGPLDTRVLVAVALVAWAGFVGYVSVRMARRD